MGVFNFRQHVNAARRQSGAARASSPSPLPPPPSSSRLAARVPAGEGARSGGLGGCARSCSLCSLTPVAAPAHCTPSHRGCSLSLPLSVSVSLPPLRLSPPRSLVWFLFHRSQPRSRRVEGSALIRPDCRNPRTAAYEAPRSALLLLPHGPASLRRRRRVEGDPDPTLVLRPDKKRTKKATRRRLQCVVVVSDGRVAAAAAAAGRLPGLLERL